MGLKGEHHGTVMMIAVIEGINDKHTQCSVKDF